MQKGKNCRIGINVSFSPDTVLGNNVEISNNVTIYPQVAIGEDCKILDGTVLDRLPLSTGNVIRPLPDDYLPLYIGDGSVIGCNSVLYTGVTLGKKT